jgi:2-polyprenyl-6-methoxyphenol hydroxylase-like FAD-dependent oxidoreductase
VEGYRPRDERVYLSYSVPGRQVARFAMRNDQSMFLFVFAAPHATPLVLHNPAAQKAALRREFGAAGWECPQILAALDRCEDFYFDHVSQIHMPRWHHGRVVLVGDAAFAPSLLAGQGAALAMTAAYVLAGELARADGTPEPAFARYEALVRSFIDDKQRAARRFAGSFAPKTALGLFLRNQVTKLLPIPGVAEVIIGRSLLDRLQLPDYPALVRS